MTVTNDKLDELETLAKDADPELDWYTNHDNWITDLPDELDKEGDRAYIAAASPDVVTALIDRVRELERALDNAVYLEPKLLRIANIANAHAALNKEST